MEIKVLSDDGEDSLEETLATQVAHISLTQGEKGRIRKWTPKFRASEAKVDKVAIWVQLIELPIEYYDSGILYKIGTSIGKLVKVDNYTLVMEKGKFARICVGLNYDKTKQSIGLPNAGKKVEKVQKEDTQNMGTVIGKFPNRNKRKMSNRNRGFNFKETKGMKGIVINKNPKGRPPITKTKEKGKRKESTNMLDNKTVCLIGGGSHRLDVAWEGNPISTKADISIRKKLTLKPTLENGSEGGPKEVATGHNDKRSLKSDFFKGKFKRKHQIKGVTSSGREALSADPHLIATYVAISSITLRSIGTYEPESLKQRKEGTIDYGDSTVPSRGETFGVSPYNQNFSTFELRVNLLIQQFRI
ncbi:hypothetical protein PVK06_031805 [Gossypium arboreum]|uniref:DUF4283 domain-containing protein n=1 Tax=Gossypium arboreum TaxID=29729 RepID=A0ABR0NUN3_GOSAR|nr:hypothetical protein PVK06_031805 [Gossypium arboreum]